MAEKTEKIRDIGDVFDEKPELQRVSLSEYENQVIIIRTVTFDETRAYGTRCLIDIEIDNRIFECYSFSTVIQDTLTILKDELPIRCKVVKVKQYLTLVSAK